MDITIGIIGLGNAGSALAKAFSKKCSVIGYDINPERYNSDNLSTVKLVNSIDELLLNTQTVVLSLPNESSSVEFPDFTRGKWKTNKPIFGLTDDY